MCGSECRYKELVTVGYVNVRRGDHVVRLAGSASQFVILERVGRACIGLVGETIDIMVWIRA